ncbi:MAG: DUF427 domain-containing protein [Pseudomonadota bacterium]
MASSRETSKLAKALAEARAKWTRGDKPAREAVGPGEESVWDYPRPPEIRPAPARARVDFAGEIIADSKDAVRIVETAGAPVYYFPPSDVRVEFLRETAGRSFCEWKGEAIYYDVVIGDRRAPDAAFAYPKPLDDLRRGFDRIAGWFGFYPARVDGCFLGDERVTPQPGGFYAGWVTQNIKGPIKGAPGTHHW